MGDHREGFCPPASNEQETIDFNHRTKAGFHVCGVNVQKLLILFVPHVVTSELQVITQLILNL